MADRKPRRAAQRRAQRRRRAVVLGTAGTLVAAGAGTAWALTGSGGPSYRLATAKRSDVTQTVDADGALSAEHSATVSFAAQGSVQSVRVHVGDHVHAGETLATLDKANLRAAVTSARGALAQARQRLADDEQAQLTGSPASSNSSSPGSSSSDSSSAKSSPTAAAATSSALSADSAHSVRLINATMAKPSGSGGTGGGTAAVRAAQHAVEAAQRALDAAIARVSSDVDVASTACATGAVNPSTRTVTADAAGTVSGTAGRAPVVVALLDTGTTSPNPQTVAAGGSYSFSGLTAGQSYTVVLVPQLDTAACAAALGTLRGDQSSTANGRSVVSAKAGLDRAITALNHAVAALASGGAATPTGSAPSGSAPSGSAPTRGSGSKGAAPSNVPSGAPSSEGSNASNGNPSSSGTTVTGAQIAADTKAIDAARAQLTVAKHDLLYATLTTPISGVVGTVNISKGQSVTASSSNATITVAGSAMSVDLNIGLSDIDLVQVGQKAHVTVDGQSRPLAATVSYVGATNTSSSTGSSSTYQVTVNLDGPDASLFDGMGATVAIDVGQAKNALTVPLSAVQTIGTIHTVTVYSGGKTSTKQVTLGVEGADRVQVTSGLSAGDQVVLAEISKAIPSSNNNPFGGSLNRLTSGGGAKPVFQVGPPR